MVEGERASRRCIGVPPGTLATPMCCAPVPLGIPPIELPIRRLNDDVLSGEGAVPPERSAKRFGARPFPGFPPPARYSRVPSELASQEESSQYVVHGYEAERSAKAGDTSVTRRTHTKLNRRATPTFFPKMVGRVRLELVVVNGYWALSRWQATRFSLGRSIRLHPRN